MYVCVCMYVCVHDDKNVNHHVCQTDIIVMFIWRADVCYIPIL